MRTYGGPSLQTQQTILETQHNIFETRVNICETQHKIIEKQHKLKLSKHNTKLPKRNTKIEGEWMCYYTKHKPIRTQLLTHYTPYKLPPFAFAKCFVLTVELF